MADTHTLRPDESFRVWTESEGDRIIVRALGELDLASSSRFEEELERALAAEVSTVVVDLGMVTFIDSTGLRALLSATERSRVSVRQFGIRKEVSGAVRRALDVTGMAEKLPFVD